RQHARSYASKLAELPVQTPELFGDDHVFHLFVIRTHERDALQSHLKAQGIHTGIHYPVPCHLQPALRGQFRATPLPVTEKVAGEILSLPMFPELTQAEIDRVVDGVSSFFAARATSGVHAAAS